MLRIALFEDNKERRESLWALIAREPEMNFVAAFDNGKNVLEKIESCKPDIVLMDIGMPGVTGIEATRTIKKAYPEIVILIQTVYEDDDNLFRSLQAGASGYILKKTNPFKITEAIMDAAAGGAPISPAMAFKVLQFFQQNKPAQNAKDYGITEKEKVVLKLLVEGCSYKMIATKENISYHTVNSHVRSIYDKLHVHSIGEAISKALKEDLTL